MGLPYERTFYLSNTVDGEQIALMVPGRMMITRIAVTSDDSNGNVEFHNRAFTSAPAKVVAVSGDGKTVTLDAFIGVRIGDTVSYQDVSNSGNNVNAIRVAKVISDTIVVLETAAAVAAGVGRLGLAMTDAEQDLARIASVAYTSNGPVGEALAVGPFVNLDPLRNVNTGIEQKIYARPLDSGNIRIAIRGTLPAAQY